MSLNCNPFDTDIFLSSVSNINAAVSSLEMEKPTTESDEFLNILSQKGIFFILKKVAQELEICYQNDLNNTLDNILT